MAPEEKTKPESDYSRQTVGKRGLRTGYTTGSCAAAAAKGAVIALLTGQPVQEVTIHLPVGRDASFALNRCEWVDDERVLASVIKDGGDDPDATHGAEICVTVSKDGAEISKDPGPKTRVPKTRVPKTRVPKTRVPKTRVPKTEKALPESAWWVAPGSGL